MPVTVKVKQSPRIKPKNGHVFDDRQSYQIGFGMLLSNKKRIQKGLGDKDEALPPLSKGYAVYKRKHGGSGIRDSVLTGQTMGNFTLRKATPTTTVAGLTQRKTRTKMLSQQQFVERRGHSIWGFSGQNIKDTFDIAEREFGKSFKQMVVIRRD